MKKLIIAACLLVAGLVLAGGWEVTTTTTSTPLCPGKEDPTLAVVGAVTAGDVVVYQGRAYFVVTNGTIATLPTNTVEDASSGVTLRPYTIHSGRLLARKTVYLDNRGTNRVWVSGAPAVVGKGLRLDAGERTFLGSTMSLSGITESGDSDVVGWEIYQ